MKELKKNLRSTKRLIEGTIVTDAELKKYVTGQNKVDSGVFDKLSDQKPKSNKEKFDKPTNKSSEPKPKESWNNKIVDKKDKPNPTGDEIFDKNTDDRPKPNKEKFDTVKESKNLIENLKNTASSIGSKVSLKESSVVQVDMPMELMNQIDSSKLPKIITIGDTPYAYSGSSTPDLQKLMTADKGVIGKIIYTQSDSEIDPSKPKEIELQIIKTINNRKTVLSIGSVVTR